MREHGIETLGDAPFAIWELYLTPDNLLDTPGMLASPGRSYLVRTSSGERTDYSPEKLDEGKIKQWSGTGPVYGGGGEAFCWVLLR